MSHSPNPLTERPSVFGPSPTERLVPQKKTPKKKPPPKSVVVTEPQQQPAPSPTPLSPTPAVPQKIAPTPPVQALKPYGVNLSINEVNDRVHNMTQAHEKAFGTKPRAGLVFDVLKSESQTGPVDYYHLFDVPKTKAEAAARKTARLAVQTGDLIATLPTLQPRTKEEKEQQDMAVNRAIIARKTANSSLDNWYKTMEKDNPVLMGSLPPPELLLTKSRLAVTPVQFLGKTAGQILRATETMPLGAYMLGKNAYLDARDIATLKDLTPTRSVRMQYEALKQVKEDFAHPWDRPGYVFLDAFAIYTGGAGTAARIAAATGKAAAAEGVIASTAALGRGMLTRPHPGVYPLGFGARQEFVPLSDNAGYRVLQRFVLAKQQKAMVNRQIEGFDPGPIAKQTYYNRFFATENKVSKLTENRMGIEYALATTPVAEMARLARWDARARTIAGELMKDPSQARFLNSMKLEQKHGVEKLLQILFTDDPLSLESDPIRAWRGFHNREIADAKKELADLADDESLDPGDFKPAKQALEYKIAAHQGQLDAITLAERILAKPSKQFVKLYQAAYRVSTRQERTYKNLALGVPQEILDQHVAHVGSILRSENIIDLPEGGRGVSAIPVDELVDRIAKKEKTLSDANARLRKAQGALRLHPEREDFKVEAANAERAVLKHNKQLGGMQQRLQKIQDQALPLEKNVPERPPVTAKGVHVEESVFHPEVAEVLHGEGRIPFVYNSETGELRYQKSGAKGAGHSDIFKTMNADVRRSHGGENPTVFSGEVYTKPTTSLRLRREGKGGETEGMEIRLPYSWSEVDPSLISKLQSIWPDFTIKALDADGNEIPMPTEMTNAVRIAGLREATGKGSAYNPFEREIYSEKGSPSSRFAVRASKYGLRPPEKPRSIRYKFTGKSIEIGDFRWDTSNLLAEEFRKAVRGAFESTMHKDAWDTGVEGPPPSPFHMPVRDIKSVPADLRKAVVQLERAAISPREAALLTEENLRALRQWRYPKREEIEKTGEHVRWVDERLIPNRVGGRDTLFWEHVDRLFSSPKNPMLYANEAGRIAYIFGTPAYILNALGAAATALIDQGFLAVPNFGRAVASHWFYGPEVTKKLDAMAGDTHAGSFMTESSKVNAPSRVLMAFWQQVTDKMFRRAAAIHYLRRSGLMKDSMSQEDLLRVLESDDPLVIDSARRARRTMLDFNSMTWFEKSVLRHLIFVYSFVHASAVWNMRLFLDHPIKAAVLAQAGADREQQIEDILGGPAPKWFLRRGYVPVTRNVFVDPVQVNMPGLLNQYAYPLYALFGDTPYSSPGELLSPGAQLIGRAVTGVDEQGRELPDYNVPGGKGRVVKSFMSLIQESPAGAAAKRAEKAKSQPDIPPPPVRASALQPIEAARAQERAAIEQSPFELDNSWQTWGRVVGRSAIPYQANAAAVTARAWRDLKKTDPERYHKHELDLVNKMVSNQESVVGEKAPVGVRQAVSLVARLSQDIDAFKEEESLDDPTERQLGMLTVDALKKEGSITPSEEKRLRTLIKNANGEREAKRLRIAAVWDHGGSAWRDWVERVNNVDYFARPGFIEALGDAKDEGLGDFKQAAAAPTKDKWSYGRQFEAYDQKRQQLAAEVRTRTGKAGEEARAAYAYFEHQQDKPVKINGVTYPSLVAVRYIKKTASERADQVVSASAGSWEHQTDFNKELLTGKKPGERTAEGWYQLANWMHAVSARLPVGKSLPPGTKKYYAEVIGKKNADFRKDYAFSQRIMAQRLSYFKQVQNSPYRDNWNSMLRTVNGRYNSLIGAGWKPTQAREQWKRYDSKVLRQWIADQPKGFQREIATYDGDQKQFVERLVNSG